MIVHCRTHLLTWQVQTQVGSPLQPRQTETPKAEEETFFILSIVLVFNHLSSFVLLGLGFRFIGYSTQCDQQPTFRHPSELLDIHFLCNGAQLLQQLRLLQRRHCHIEPLLGHFLMSSKTPKRQKCWVLLFRPHTTVSSGWFPCRVSSGKQAPLQRTKLSCMWLHEPQPTLWSLTRSSSRVCFISHGQQDVEPELRWQLGGVWWSLSSLDFARRAEFSAGLFAVRLFPYRTPSLCMQDERKSSADMSVTVHDLATVTCSNLFQNDSKKQKPEQKQVCSSPKRGFWQSSLDDLSWQTAAKSRVPTFLLHLLFIQPIK